MALLSPVPSPEVAAITALAVLGQCPNCEVQLPEPLPRFCHACGQETNIKPPPVGEFLQQFSGTYFATEGALWRTFKLLLSQPGELTARYLNGRRKQYVLPLRLFLSLTLVMLVTVRILGAIQLSALEDPELARTLAERPSQVSLDMGFVRAGVHDGRFYCEGLPPWLCQRIRAKLDTSTAELLHQVERVNDHIVSYAGVVMFVLLPGFALGLALLFRYRGFSYTEHLVFALHLHAFWFLMAALMMVGLSWFEPLAWLALLAMPAHAALAFRRVYGGKRWLLTLRAMALMFVHSTLVLLMVAVSALTALVL